MLKRVMVVVLLGFVGLGAGIAVTGLGGQRYRADAELVLRPNSDASRVVAMTRGEHPGVRVLAYGGRVITVTATGSPEGAGRAVSAAIREVSQHADGQVVSVMRGLENPEGPLGNRVHYGLLGLVAGLSAALGFLVPPRSRVTAVH